ncbi:hypothetical protein D3C75_1201370 [compost metagenome]
MCPEQRRRAQLLEHHNIICHEPVASADKSVCSLAFTNPGFAPKQDTYARYVHAYPMDRELGRQRLHQIAVQLGDELRRGVPSPQ